MEPAEVAEDAEAEGWVRLQQIVIKMKLQINSDQNLNTSNIVVRKY